MSWRDDLQSMVETLERGGASSFAMEGREKLICHGATFLCLANAVAPWIAWGILESLDRKGKLLQGGQGEHQRLQGLGREAGNRRKGQVTAVGQKLQGDIVVDTAFPTWT